jgi:hypothetical protein
MNSEFLTLSRKMRNIDSCMVEFNWKIQAKKMTRAFMEKNVRLLK